MNVFSNSYFTQTHKFGSIGKVGMIHPTYQHFFAIHPMVSVWTKLVCQLT